MFEKLAKHKSIGIDFDGTLVQSPASPLIQQFILDNPDKRFCIVTFRSHGTQNEIWDDLSYETLDLTPDHFEKIINIPDEIFFHHFMCLSNRESGLLTGPLTEPELLYLHWKGLICHENGLTALIDDRIDDCHRGCTKYGVELFNPLDFLEPPLSIDNWT